MPDPTLTPGNLVEGKRECAGTALPLKEFRRAGRRIHATAPRIMQPLLFVAN